MNQPSPGDAQLAYWLSQDPRPESFVYLIQAECDLPFKIGVAKDVRARIAGLQTGNPRPLRLLLVLVGSTELECQLHRRLKDCRMMGEWFAGKEEQMMPTFELMVRLAAEMVDVHKETGKIPHFREFKGNWARTRHQAPMTIRYTEPNPVPPEEKLERERAAIIEGDVARSKYSQNCTTIT